jgi:hypothetical protein
MPLHVRCTTRTVHLGSDSSVSTSVIAMLPGTNTAVDPPSLLVGTASGTHPVKDASQAGVVALLDTVAARAGRAAELLAEAAALRAAVPRLSRLAWQPADAEGDWTLLVVMHSIGCGIRA